MVFRYWIGSLFVVLGLGALLDQVYFFDFGHWLSMLWPLAFILLGILFLITRETTILGSIILTLFGSFLLLSTLGLAKENFWDLLWPTLLILAGIYFIFWIGRRPGPATSSTDFVQHFAIFSGLETKHTTANFRGGSVMAMFGGANIDLRDTKLSPEGALLELTAAFGGITVFVPEGWKLDISGLPLFGGWSNKTRNQPTAADAPILRLRCMAFCGGIDIKN
jgi:predicted membrane protein